MKNIFFIFTLFFLVVFSFHACSVARKIDAATILKNTKIEFQEITIDSFTIDSDLFQNVEKSFKQSLLPNPQVVTLVQDLAKGIIKSKLGTASLSARFQVESKSRDTLWIRSLEANLQLDSIMTLPLSIKDSSKILPDSNEITLFTSFTVDKKIFELFKTKWYSIKGILIVALDKDGESIPLEFNIKNEITPEQMITIQDNIRQTILNGLINDWVGSFFTE